MATLKSILKTVHQLDVTLQHVEKLRGRLDRWQVELERSPHADGRVLQSSYSFLAISRAIPGVSSDLRAFSADLRETLKLIVRVPEEEEDVNDDVHGIEGVVEVA